MKRNTFVRIGKIAVISGVVWVLVAVSLVVLGGNVEPPPRLESVSKPFESVDFSTLPTVLRYKARDGADLSYRFYPAAGNDVAVLIHGSAGNSTDTHALATVLQKAGVAVYVPDLRGHGDNLPRGDIAYLGQLDDDMIDFLRFAKPRFPKATWTLVGFSSGGGFALRIAANKEEPTFNRFVLVSPYLMYNAPTIRTAASEPVSGDAKPQVWAKPYIARIIGLVSLNYIGVHWFNHLTVVAFALPADVPGLTTSYSYNMQQNFQPHRRFMADIRAVSKPMTVFVGGSDELFVPEKFQEVFGAERHDIPVTIIPGFGHIDMITKPAPIQAIVNAVTAR